MKTRFLVITIALAVLLGGASSAFAWPACSGTWVAVAPEVGSAGGALYTDGHGETWQCQVKVPDSSGSNSNASANSNQSQIANGGSATGGSSSAVGSSAGNNGVNYGTVNSGAIASGGAGGSSSSTSAGGSASAVDNAKNTNTSSNTNLNAPVANGGSATATNGSVTDNSKTTNTNTALGGAGGSVKDSGNSSSTATGGSVKDSGNSTIKDSGNSSSTSGVKNSGNSSSTVKDSGNSSNKNTNNVAGSTQSQSSSSVSGSSSAGSGNSTAINTEVEASKIPVATAYAPMIAPTVTCFKGASGAVQTMAAGVSFGVGRIDENCAILEAARSGAAYTGRIAFCKVYITNKYVKKAGVTLEDCLQRDEKPVPVVVAPAPAPAPIINVLPAPVVATPVAVTPAIVQRETVQLVGTCFVAHFNACTRVLDSALLRLHNANDPAASISITGPIEATTKASRYLRDRATDPARISLHIEDINEITISTTIEE